MRHTNKGKMSTEIITLHTLHVSFLGRFFFAYFFPLEICVMLFYYYCLGDVNIIGQGGKDQVLWKSGCNPHFQMFYFLFLFLGIGVLRKKSDSDSQMPQYPGVGNGHPISPQAPNLTHTPRVLPRWFLLL